MPTRTYKRTWCKVCNDWTLHHIVDNEKLICKECKSEFTNIILNDIPENKLIKQRNRYSESNNPFINGLMFLEFNSNINIIEDDAGQIIIDEQNKIKYQKHAEERQKQKEEELKYKNLNINDTCICGSNKKFKHCCLNKFKK